MFTVMIANVFIFSFDYKMSNRDDRFSQLNAVKNAEKKEGISPIAFGISVTFLIILAVLVVILIILYYRRDSNLIKTENCPPSISGLVVQSDNQLNTTATNCGTQINCTYTVQSLKEAEQICRNLGTVKCAAFSLKQVPNSDDFTMKVSDETGVSIDLGSDVYRIVE